MHNLPYLTTYSTPNEHNSSMIFLIMAFTIKCMCVMDGGMARQIICKMIVIIQQVYISLCTVLDAVVLWGTAYHIDPQGSFLDITYLCTKVRKKSEFYHKFHSFWTPDMSSTCSQSYSLSCSYVPGNFE